MTAVVRQRSYDDLLGTICGHIADTIAVTHDSVRRRNIEISWISSRWIKGDTEGPGEAGREYFRGLGCDGAVFAPQDAHLSRLTFRDENVAIRSDPNAPWLIETLREKRNGKVCRRFRDGATQPWKQKRGIGDRFAR